MGNNLKIEQACKLAKVLFGIAHNNQPSAAVTHLKLDLQVRYAKSADLMCNN